MIFTKYSIKPVLSAVYLVGVLAPIIILTFIITSILSNAFRDEILNDSLRLAERLAKDARIALIHNAKESVISSVNMIQEFPNVEQVSIYSINGELLVGEQPQPISFADITAQEYTIGNAIIIRETENRIYIVAPAFIKSSPSELTKLIGEYDKHTIEPLGYVLLHSNKGKLKSLTHEIWIDSFITVLVIAILLLFTFLVILRKITAPISNLANLMKQPATAKHYKTTQLSGVKEIREIYSAYNHLMEELKIAHEKLLDMNAKLETRVEARTADLKNAHDVALKLNEENRTLINGMNKILEDERKYVARELHDQLNSTLVAIMLRLKKTKAQCMQLDTHKDKSSHSNHSVNISDNIESITKMISNVYESSRNIVRMLRPEIIDSLGIVGAIDELITNYNESSKNCEFQFIKEGSFDDLDYDYTITLYRIIQESLSNIAKHANASYVSVMLYRHTDEYPRDIVVVVTDNGKGFIQDKAKVTSSIGLLSMRERTHALGGELNIETEIGEGTTVIVKIPDTLPRWLF